MEPKDLLNQIKNSKIVIRPVIDLMPYARNSNVHPQWQIKHIKDSIVEFGFTNPVLIDEEGTIICGHGRVLAALDIGLEQVPCIEAGHMTEVQRRAYVIADNQLTKLSIWDKDLLKSEIEELDLLDFKIELTGFDRDEFDLDEPDFGPGDEDDQGKLDEKKKIICPECKHEFES